MDELGPYLGGEGPRAEGGRGKVNLPPIHVLTRPTKGSADFNVILSAKTNKSQVPKSTRFFIEFGYNFGSIFRSFWH